MLRERVTVRCTVHGCVQIAKMSEKQQQKQQNTSDVKRGQNVEAEAEVNFSSLRPRPRPKIIVKKYQIMINNIRLTI